MRYKLFAFLLGCAAVAPIVSHAQVSPDAYGASPHLWAGAEYSLFSPDWVKFVRLPGIAIFADLSAYKRYGLEGEARFLDLTKPHGLTEKSFLGGPFVTVYKWRGLSANAKGLIGAGLITYPDGEGYGSYFEIAAGGNVDYRISHKWKARFDYEYLFMPSAPGDVFVGAGNSHGLTPSGVSGGLSYRIF